ncbi:MAG: hypothetical protein JNL05_00020 [Flavobacteriales bacterium]|nr:hypothetical protein [Flavobacteriales bacterium]
MTENSISTFALAICMLPGILHSVEVAYPMMARLIVNYVLPFFEPGLPKARQQLTAQEQMGMLDAALSSVPEEKKTAAGDYVFLLLFEQRQNSLAFLSVMAGIIYGMQLPLEEREILHFLLMMMSALFMLVNANHAGISFLGKHPKVSLNGRNVGIAFTPIWLVGAVLNYMAFNAIAH